MSELYFYLDGKYSRTNERLLENFTPGLQMYHGVFETMLVRGKNIEYVDEHLARMHNGLKVLKIKHAYSLHKLKTIIRSVARKNPFISTGRLRLMIFQEDRQVHCACMVIPYKPYSIGKYRNGLRAMVLKTNRSANARHAHVKSLDYGTFANALALVRSKGYDEAILINNKGHVHGTSRGNIFVLHQGCWITPPLSSGCLKGIMRGKVMDLAERIGMGIQEKNITTHMLYQAHEAMMTNSLIGVIRFKAHP